MKSKYKDFSLFTLVGEQANNYLHSMLSAFSQKPDIQSFWEDFSVFIFIFTSSSPPYTSLIELQTQFPEKLGLISLKPFFFLTVQWKSFQLLTNLVVFWKDKQI